MLAPADGEADGVDDAAADDDDDDDDDIFEILVTLLDLCVPSLRRGHANLLCIVPILTDDPRRESS